MKKIREAAGAGLVLAVWGWATLAGAATFTVVDNASTTEPGTIQWAILQANLTAELDTIDFAVPGSNSITVYDSLDIIQPVIIDGGGTQVIGMGTPGSPLFQFLSGSSGSTLKGVAVVGAGTGVYILSDNNRIVGCAIGTDWSGHTGLGNTIGIFVFGDYNAIGGTGAGERNSICGNLQYGIYSESSTGLVVANNYIGVAASGNTPLANGVGVMLANGTSGALIGGDRGAGQGNVISGNYLGIQVSSGSTGNSLCGNIIGLNAGQSEAIPNHSGVGILGASGNAIGLPQAGRGNIISGNEWYGIFLEGTPRPRLNRIQNNVIGLNDSGAALRNETGIFCNGADDNWIGGLRGGGSLEGNVISANERDGINVVGHGNTVSGNWIGTSLDGTSALGNLTGIQINGDGNQIGGPNTGPGQGQGNVIAGHSAYGIVQAGGNGNRIQGNWIGVNAAGNAALPNGDGVFIDTLASQGTVIGGAEPVLRNVIAGNDHYEIFMRNTRGHTVSGNYLGVNNAGLARLGSALAGIFLENTNQCLIGGPAAGAGNIIYTLPDGVIWQGAGTQGNTLAGNWIGVLADRSLPGVAMDRAVSIGDGASGNFIGFKGPGPGNLLARAGTGILIAGGSTQWNGIYTNTITAFSTAAIVLGDGANHNQAPPVIVGAASTLVTGTAQANDAIDVYVADRAAGAQGGSLKWVGATVADALGNWSLAPSGLQGGQVISAVATDADNNSSEFAVNFLVAADTPTPTLTATPSLTLTPTPSASPSPTVTPTAGSRVPTATATPERTLTPTPTVTVILPDRGLVAFNSRINPLRGEKSVIRWFQPDSGPVSVRIYTQNGRQVRALADHQPYASGRQSLAWDGRNTAGEAVATGIYIVVVEFGDGVERTRIAVIK